MKLGLGLAIVGGLIFTGTLSMVGIINGQIESGVWNVLYQPLGFFIFMVCGLAETNRTPFDLPEGESEIVGGFHTEYSGFRWSLFFLSEYTAVVIVSCVAVTLYLGGWHVPFVTGRIDREAMPALYAIVGLTAFMAKVLVLIYSFMWFRWTFPRYRYDQLMDLGWKWLTPAALVNIVLTGIVYVLLKHGFKLPFAGPDAAFIGPSTMSSKLTMIGVMFLVATPIALALVAFINRGHSGLGDRRSKAETDRSPRSSKGPNDWARIGSHGDMWRQLRLRRRMKFTKALSRYSAYRPAQGSSRDVQATGPKRDRDRAVSEGAASRGREVPWRAASQSGP